MTEDNFKAELQTARDMLQLVRNQCTAAQNETVQIGAQFLAEQRKVEALTKKVTELETEVADLNSELANVSAPRANGHDDHATA